MTTAITGEELDTKAIKTESSSTPEPTEKRVKSRRGRKPITDPNHLSPSQRMLLVLICEHDGEPLTKRELSDQIGRDVHTANAAITRLRRRGLVETSPRFDDNGGQLASVYNVTDLARQTYPDLLESVTSPND